MEKQYLSKANRWTGLGIALLAPPALVWTSVLLYFFGIQSGMSILKTLSSTMEILLMAVSPLLAGFFGCLWLRQSKQEGQPVTSPRLILIAGAIFFVMAVLASLRAS